LHLSQDPAGVGGGAAELWKELGVGPWEVLSHHVGSREARKWPDPRLTGPKIHQIGALLDPYSFFFCLIFRLDGVALSLAWEGEWKE